MKDQELIRILRDQLAKLEPLERTLLALYYGAGLSQHEISLTLDVPQTTVSLKIRDALGRLRAEFTLAGFAASIPLLEAGKLGDAVMGTEPVPPGLHGKIMSGLSAAAHNSIRGTAISGTKVSIGVLASIGILVGAAAGYSAWKPNPQVPASQPVVAANGKEVSIPPFHGQWDFSASDQLDALFGTGHAMTWFPEGGPDGSGCMATPRAITATVLRIPRDLKLPVRARWREKLCDFAPGLDRGLLTLGWTDSSLASYAIFRNLGSMLESQLSRTPWRSGELYLSGHFMDVWLDGKRTSVSYVDLNADRSLTFISRGSYLVDDLEIKEISPDDLPDLGGFQSLIDAIPPDQRSGTHPLPQLESPRPDQKVELEFVRIPACDAPPSASPK